MFLKDNEKSMTEKSIKKLILSLPIISLIVFFADKILVYIGLLRSSLIDQLPFWIILLLLIPIVLLPIIDFILINDIEENSKKFYKKNKK